jgi:hypothetical protein
MLRSKLLGVYFLSNPHFAPGSAGQAALNLKRWAEVLADPELARLPHRIETDGHGHILMSPPPAPKHGQSEVAHLLRSFFPTGRVVTECPLATSDGVKALDVAWLQPGRAQRRFRFAPRMREWKAASSRFEF